MAYFYDRKHGTKETQPFVPGEQVRVRTDTEKSWQTTGTITKQVAPRSFLVSTGQGTYRRTARHIMTDKSAGQPISNAPPTQPPPPQSDDDASNANTETRNVTSAAPPEEPTTTNNVVSQRVMNENTTTPVTNNSQFPTTRSGRTVKPVSKLNLEIQRIDEKG